MNSNSRRKKSNTEPLQDESALVYGKVPPQSKELEKAILGAILLESEALEKVGEILTPDCFYEDAHQRIYTVMRKMALACKKIDAFTLAEWLKASGDFDIVGGYPFISSLTNSVVSSAHIEDHAEIIRDKFKKRELIKVCGSILTQAYDDTESVNDLLDTILDKLGEVATKGVRDAAEKIDTIVARRYNRIVEMAHRAVKISGVPSGLGPVDDLTSGWQQKNLIILAARPSVGKTALALNIARNASCNPIKPTPVAIFSMEMDKEKLSDRLMSAESGIHFEKFQNYRFTERELESLYTNGVVPLAQNCPIFIEDSFNLNVLELRAKARRLHRKHGVGLFIIDYLQLMSSINDKNNSSSQTRDRELAVITRNLKGLAMELNVPIIALSQMSRDIEKNGRESPKLSDVRDSGAIEQDADDVAFITRSDYQQLDFEGKEEDKDIGFLWFLKHRNGPLERVALRTVYEIQKWMTNEEYITYQNNKKFF